MSFLGNLKKALVSDDTPKPATPVTVVKPTSDYVPPTGTGTALAAQGVLDVPSITADIENEIQSNPSYALYKKFEDQLNILKSVPGMDEATRFRAAAATVGAAPDDLVTALGSHESVLANSSSRFESEFVTGVKSQIEDLKTKTEAAEQKVQDLTQQLGAASQDKTDLVTATQQKTIDLGKADVDFKGIVAALGTKYRDMSVKVQQHLRITNVK
jgi:hypothetical protein